MFRIFLKSVLSAALLATAVILLKGCISKTDVKDAQVKTENLFQKELKKKDVHNAFFAVYSPKHNIEWNFAGGHFQNGEEVSTDNPFYTASIGKTFTATAISVLMEQGRLSFQDKISQYLPDSIVDNLHVFEGKDYSREITIEQLLQHTSGLPDYFEDETIDGSPNMMQQIFTDTAKFWKPVETICFMKENMQPLFPPGTGFHYTDTEYVLLGLIIEQVSEMKLHDFFKVHFFGPFEMKHSYMFLRSAPLEKTERLSESYVDDFKASSMTSLSADWAGGGLVSTSNDLVRFLHALFNEEIISKQTLAQMQNWIPETRGMEYGFGLRKIEFKKLFPTLPDLTVIGHSGSTGSFMFYCPELDVYLAGTLNQTDEVRSSVVLMVKVLSVINRIADSQSQNQ